MSKIELFESLGLSKEPKRVLVVEDFCPALLGVTKRLEEHGHSVTPVLGISMLQSTKATGIGIDGPVPLEFSEFNYAFLDYYFLGGITNGGKLTEILVAFPQLSVIGMSSSGNANLEMERAGARLVMRKPLLLMELHL
jgi:CheY-like chemotaxis protein